MIDTHAHLNFPDYKNDLPAVLERATQAGVGTIINIGTSLATSRESIELARRYDHIYAAVGIHPHDAANIKESDWTELEKLVDEDKVVAVGEIGLDFYKNISPREDQKKVFIKQLEIARRKNKPIVIHSREAHEDCLAIIKKVMGSKVKGVAHCFSGTAETARQYLKLGFLISVGGPITFPKADQLRKTIKSIKVENLMLETDCPFLTPQAKRGQRNEPAYLTYSVQAFADLYDLSVDDIKRITTLNARRLFGLGKIPNQGQIAYNIRDSLYLNITNQCTATCTFCIRQSTDYVKGHNLRLAQDPSKEEIIQAISDLSPYKEVVFCGYGEPTLRLDIIKEIAGYLKKKNVHVRLNTNGHGNLINQRSILPELKGLVDEIVVSLNAPTAEQYQQICRPKFGPDTFNQVIQFIKEAKENIPCVQITTVTYPNVDLEKCRQLARDLGIDFRARVYNEVG